MFDCLPFIPSEILMAEEQAYSWIYLLIQLVMISYVKIVGFSGFAELKLNCWQPSYLSIGK